ncbi:MAG: Nramp family divalent metal transporter [Candidatus Aminicenantales bacterium]
MSFASLLMRHRPRREALAFLRYIGPGLLVTVGFIDPGNWASNIAAGSSHGYTLLWVVTLATLMLLILQHNAAHLGIASGQCLAEAATKHLPPVASKFVLGSALLAAVSTALAEVLGAALGLSLLFPGLPYEAGAVLVLAVVLVFLFRNSYPRLEKWIIAFVSLIGLSFLFELTLVDVSWGQAAVAWVVPRFPGGSMPIIMAILGAVVMPHNIFLHSEIIQSRQWNVENETVIRRQLKFEFADTLFSMTVGWGINSAMIIIAAATFLGRVRVTEIGQAHQMLGPLLGSAAAIVFALALLLSGLASSITAGMAGGSIFSGIFGESYDIKDLHSRIGAVGTLIAATAVVFFIGNPFRGLIVSQMLLSMQLPITIVTQIRLTSSTAVMGNYANSGGLKVLLWTVAAVVIGLNVLLLKALIWG